MGWNQGLSLEDWGFPEEQGICALRLFSFIYEELTCETNMQRKTFA